MAQKQTFVKTVLGKDTNGLPEWKALFVNGDSNLAKAFSSVSAKDGLKAMGGVTQLNSEQIGQRIDQLKAKGGHEETIEQLEHGRTAIQAKLAAPKVQVAVNSGMRVTS